MPKPSFPVFGKRRRAELREQGALQPATNSDSDGEEAYEWAEGKDEESDKQLRNVFHKIDTRGDDKLDVNELEVPLQRLGITAARKVAQDLVWEVDEDMDGYIGWEEFKTSYRRAAADQLGKEPRKLFNIMEFLMADDDNSGTLTVEEALECYGKRYGLKNIDALVGRLFTEEERSDPTAALSFAQYCERDQRFLSEVSKLRKDHLLTYGRIPEDQKMELSTFASVPRQGTKPVWRGGGRGKRSSSSVGSAEDANFDLMLRLGFTATAAERQFNGGLKKGRARRRNSLDH